MSVLSKKSLEGEKFYIFDRQDFLICVVNSLAEVQEYMEKAREDEDLNNL